MDAALLEEELLLLRETWYLPLPYGV